MRHDRSALVAAVDLEALSVELHVELLRCLKLRGQLLKRHLHRLAEDSLRAGLGDGLDDDLALVLLELRREAGAGHLGAKAEGRKGGRAGERFSEIQWSDVAQIKLLRPANPPDRHEMRLQRGIGYLCWETLKLLTFGYWKF